MSFLPRTLKNILPEWAGGRAERRPINRFNPKRDIVASEAIAPRYSVFDYNAETLEERGTLAEHECKLYRDNGRVTWINVDGLQKDAVERICAHFNIHALVVEDILNVGQRAKMDDLGSHFFCLLPMLFYNKNTGAVDVEQVSLLVGHDYLISFQEDALRDAFGPVRDKLRKGMMRLRSSSPEYLAYTLIDAIVDNYFEVIEALDARVERLEDALLEQNRKATLAHISMLRREVMVLGRAILPVRELINDIVHSENKLLDEGNEKYWSDVRDHIIQASEYSDGLRDMIHNLHNLLMSQVNMRMNEVMKVFTMVTTLLAPATVIGGIYGMNFEHMPLLKSPQGFWGMIVLMFAIPAMMLMWFKRKGWF